MNLAEKTEHGPMAKLEVVASPVGPSPSRLSPTIDFRQLARRPGASATLLTTVKATPTPHVEAASAPPPAAPMVQAAALPSASAHSPAVAMDLLAEVSGALSVLMERCQDLEGALGTTRDKARTDLAAANAATLQSEQRADVLRSEMTLQEQAIADLKQRLAAAEERAAAIQAMAEKTQHAAAEAECLSALFQEKVLTSFGIGSAGHAILESVRNRTQLMLTA